MKMRGDCEKGFLAWLMTEFQEEHSLKNWWLQTIRRPPRRSEVNDRQLVVAGNPSSERVCCANPKRQRLNKGSRFGHG
jgi:hypothetical protein